jgi:hypothetical protein
MRKKPPQISIAAAKHKAPKSRRQRRSVVDDAGRHSMFG